MGRYYHTKESAEEYIRMARGHDGKEIIVLLKEFLPAHSSLLEIGSGPGTDWALLKAIYKVIGSDNSQEFLKHLMATYPEGEFLLLDASTLDTSLKLGSVVLGKVDGVAKLHKKQVEQAGFELVEELDLFEENYFLTFRGKGGDGE